MMQPPATCYRTLLQAHEPEMEARAGPSFIIIHLSAKHAQ
jgi:hypothetical protein